MNDGIWVAYYSDWSGFAVFEAEIDALRYAVRQQMRVEWMPYGVDLRDFVAGLT